MLRIKSTDDTFTLVHIPYYRLIGSSVGLVVTGIPLLWMGSNYFLNRVSVDIWSVILLGVVFAASVVLLVSTRTTKLIVNRHLRNVYLVRMLGAWRTLRSFEFDEVSEGLYVDVEESWTDSSNPRFWYSLRLRLKFDEDPLVAPRTNQYWKHYTDAVCEANKYFNNETQWNAYKN